MPIDKNKEIELKARLEAIKEDTAIDKLQHKILNEQKGQEKRDKDLANEFDRQQGEQLKTEALAPENAAGGLDEVDVQAEREFGEQISENAIEEEARVQEEIDRQEQADKQEIRAGRVEIGDQTAEMDKIEQDQATNIEKVDRLGDHVSAVEAYRQALLAGQESQMHPNTVSFVRAVDAVFGTNNSRFITQPPTELERLKALAELEQAGADLKVEAQNSSDKVDQGRAKEARMDIRSWEKRVSGAMRGAQLFGDLIKNKQGLAKITNYLVRIQSGDVILDEPTSLDISSTMSRIIKGTGQVAQELINSTTFKSIFRNVQQWKNFITGKPGTIYTSEQLQQIASQVTLLVQDSHNNFAKEIAEKATLLKSEFAHAPEKARDWGTAFKDSMRQNQDGTWSPIFLGTPEQQAAYTTSKDLAASIPDFSEGQSSTFGTYDVKKGKFKDAKDQGVLSRLSSFVFGSDTEEAPDSEELTDKEKLELATRLQKLNK